MGVEFTGLEEPVTDAAGDVTGWGVNVSPQSANLPKLVLSNYRLPLIPFSTPLPRVSPTLFWRKHGPKCNIFNDPNVLLQSLILFLSIYSDSPKGGDGMRLSRRREGSEFYRYFNTKSSEVS